MMFQLLGLRALSVRQPLRGWMAVCWGLLVAALLTACGGGDGTSATSASASGDRLQAALVETPKSLGMKLLLVSANQNATNAEPSYAAVKALLNQIGVPYDEFNASTTALTEATLSDSAGNGKYQGIILTTDSLGLGGVSQLTAAEWQILVDYERNYRVRQVTAYTSPYDSAVGTGVSRFGVVAVGTATDTAAAPRALNFTAAGANLFNYLNTANPIQIKNSFTYLATAVAGTETVPLLTDSANNVIVSTHTTPDGRENLAITASSDNDDLSPHFLLMGHGIVNWVTRGVFIGARKIYLSAQPDDVFIPDTIWEPTYTADPGCNTIRPLANPCPEYRINGVDYDKLIAWQTAMQASSTKTAAIRLEMPFNGTGYETDGNDNPLVTDALSVAVRANSAPFRWINHTWDHHSLNNTVDPLYPTSGTLTVAQMEAEFLQNHQLATGLRGVNTLTFANYNQNALIQPDISGLENPYFWTAAKNFGFRYILMDTSKGYASFSPATPASPIDPRFYNSDNPNTGYTSALDTSVPKILIIPRYPTNLFYNVDTPAIWESEYNYFYGPTGTTPAYGTSQTYAQILDNESDRLLYMSMLKYNANSWMFHQANLRAYGTGNNSLLSDLLDATLAKYKNMYNLPVVSPSQTEIGQIMEARMAFNAALAGGLTGKIVFGPTVMIQLTNPTGAAVSIPMTGVTAVPTTGATTQTYGAQTQAAISVAAGGSVSFAAPAAWIPPQADLGIALTAGVSAPLQGGTLTYSVVVTNLGPSTVTGASFSDSLPTGLGTLTGVSTAASAGASTATFTNTGTALSGSLTLPAGGVVTVTFRVTVSGTATGVITNNASVSVPAGITDTNAANNTASAVIGIGTSDMITSVDLPASATEGSVVTGTVTFTNAASGGSSATASAVAGTVTLTTGEVRTFALGNIAPGASVVQTFTATVPAYSTANTLGATSAVATTTLESSTANNTATDVLQVVAVPVPPPPPPTGGGGGGCTTSPDAPFDPLLWLMLLGGMGAVVMRRRMH